VAAYEYGNEAARDSLAILQGGTGLYRKGGPCEPERTLGSVRRADPWADCYTCPINAF
jgi:hypothetical protein